MTLSADKLTGELRKINDSSQAGFGGFPMRIDDVRERWAAAFAVYIADVVVTTTTVVPKNTTADGAGVKAAFKGPLLFAPKLDARAEAVELSNAWAAGMRAFVLKSGAGYLGSPTSAITVIVQPFPGIDTVRATLETSLAALFGAPAISVAARDGEIAQALHAATIAAAKTTCTYTVGTGTSTGNLEFG